MKSILRFIVPGITAAWAAVCVLPVWGEPVPPRSTGKVLVLESGRTLEGDIEIHGNQLRIRRSAGEVWVPVEPGMRLCADWNEAFAFMASQSNRLDPDERVRLARWCQLHGLPERALAEVTAAVQMQPSHREARQMRDMLQRTLAMEKTETATAAGAIAAPPAKLPTLDISSDSVAVFTTRVQPILMNTCVNCHSGARAGRFQLYRTYNGGQRAATLKNLAAVLALVDPERPELSALLIKAVSPHSSTTLGAPLKKESVPFYTLQTWVLQLLTSNPQLRAQRSNALDAASGQAARSKLEQAEARFDPKSTAALIWKMEELAREKTAAASKAASKAAPAKTEIAKPGPIIGPSEPTTAFAAPASPPPVAVTPTSFSEQSRHVPTEPADPFDPVIFNQQSRPPQ
jgi:hypothetical protein